MHFLQMPSTFLAPLRTENFKKSFHPLHNCDAKPKMIKKIDTIDRIKF